MCLRLRMRLRLRVVCSAANSLSLIIRCIFTHYLLCSVTDHISIVRSLVW